MISRDLRPARGGLIALCLAGLSLASSAYTQKTIDRVAAVVDRQVIAVSEIDQMVAIRFFPRRISGSDDDYRHDVLDALIAQSLRLTDVQRFGGQEIPKDSIEARLQEIEKRFGSPAEFDAALARAELTRDDVRALAKRQLQVENYIQEHFAPVIYISNDDIQTYYGTTWSQQRRERGLRIPPLTEVREEIRSLLKANRLQGEVDEWTNQLRERFNVDVYTWRALE